MKRTVSIMAGIALAAGAAQAQEPDQPTQEPQERPTEVFDESVRTEEDRRDRSDAEEARQREHGTPADLREPFETEGEQKPLPVEERYDPRAGTPASDADDRRGADAGVQGPPSGLLPATTADLPGKTIVTSEGEEVGTVEQVGYSRQHDERVATVNVGGFLGAGDKVIAIPISELGLGGEADLVTTALDRRELETAPEFDPATLITAETARPRDRSRDHR